MGVVWGNSDVENQEEAGTGAQGVDGEGGGSRVSFPFIEVPYLLMVFV